MIVVKKFQFEKCVLEIHVVPVSRQAAGPFLGAFPTPGGDGEKHVLLECLLPSTSTPSSYASCSLGYTFNQRPHQTGITVDWWQRLQLGNRSPQMLFFWNRVLTIWWADSRLIVTYLLATMRGL